MPTRAWIQARWRRILLGATLVAAAVGAQASGDEGRRMPARVPGAYTQECAACHMAYPPSLLGRGSWQRLMSDLPHHFGSDASLDPKAVREIAGWLQANAANDWRAGIAPPQDRITRSAWFERKHRGIEPAVWKLPSIKSAAHCAACHTGAEQGRFDDDQLRLPVGLTAAQRRRFHD